MNTYQKTAHEFHEQFMHHWESNECFQKKCITSLDLCDETLQKLKVLVLEKGFDNLQDEVRFFKEVKPKILSMKFAIRALMEYDLEKKHPTRQRPRRAAAHLFKQNAGQIRFIQGF